MAVEIRGQLVLLEGEPVITGLRTVHPEPGQEPELLWANTPHVRIANADHLADTLRPLLGFTIFGRGVWTGDAVTVTSIAANSAWSQRAFESYGRRDLTVVAPRIRVVEAPLFSSGAMLRRVRVKDDLGTRVLVSATDVERVRAALTPIYGADLEVYQSPWTVSEIRSLDDVLNDLPEERVLTVEYRTNAEGVPSRKLRVDYVDDELVHLLRPFRSEMLFIEAVIEPAGTVQDRDHFHPIRPRTRRAADVVPAARR